MTAVQADAVRRGIVAIVRSDHTSKARIAAHGLLAAGVPSIEITLTVPGAVGLIAELADAGHCILAGTVLRQDDLVACRGAGAVGAVSPVFDSDLVSTAHRAGLAIFPGALTPTEIARAAAARPTGVKVFPVGAVGGVGYIEGLRGPFPDIPLMVTGGISVSDATRYLEAGAHWVGIGAALLDQAAIDAEDVDGVAAFASAVLGHLL
jgi:2-dehydro-3-deoxyphosphogluconate aldolase/(4S)-4-hydroxy-2-oxoglutarate aldolase